MLTESLKVHMRTNRRVRGISMYPVMEILSLNHKTGNREIGTDGLKISTIRVHYSTASKVK